MLDKVNRLTALGPTVAGMLNTDASTTAAVKRAAELCKSDLVTNMVVEMTSLQGIIGEIYAKKSGESDAVAQAIREHYLPRSSGDANPASPAGLALSLADKVDSLVGLFAVGASPTGSADPFGLRRAALGVVNNLLATQTDLDLRAAVDAAAALQPVTVTPEAQAETLDFITRRLQGVLLDEGYRHDVVDAVLAVRGHNPSAARRAADGLTSLVTQPWWDDAFTAYARCARITRNVAEEFALDADAYELPVEQALHDAYLAAAAAMESSATPEDALGGQIQALQAPINAYFDSVLVNADDERVRKARLALVQRIAALPGGIADLSRLQGF
jgi:glycyl-tRNA synthetase